LDALTSLGLKVKYVAKKMELERAWGRSYVRDTAESRMKVKGIMLSSVWARYI